MRYLCSLALVAGFGLSTTAEAKAIAIAIPQPRQLAVQAQAIVVGKVIELEKNLVEVEAFPKAPNKVGYQVATIKIAENLVGAKGLTNIRVGWQPAPNPVNPGVDGGPAIRPIRPIRGLPQTNLTQDQEGMFFLQQHPVGDFYVLVQWSQPIDKKAENFAKEVEQVKSIVKVLESPVESLKAKETAEQQNAAHILLQKYRQYPQNFDGQQPKEEEISAEESKLILKIIAGMDWGKFDPQTGVGMQQLFGLAVTQGEKGFVYPKFEQGMQDYNKVVGDAAKKWLTENAETYRVKKFVAVKK